jgi:hypothetical protein
MNDQNENKQATPTPTQGSTGVSPSVLEALVKTMLEREARLAAKEAKDLADFEHKQAQRKRNADSHFSDANETQVKCRHLKGGKGHKRRGFGKDYAVYIHTYPNAEQVIRCFLCGMKWKRRDTDEFLLRGDGNGKLVKIVNHTGIGWAKAVEMLADTTNTPSSSEIPIQATPTISNEGV